MKDIVIRSASLSDAGALLGIYSHYVEKTAITFEYDVPSPENFAQRIENTLKKYPYILAELNGSVIGYAYAETFKARAAYDYCVEVTIYLSPAAHGQGIGKMLYTELERRLKEMGILNLYACIAVTDKEDEFLTNQSEGFHSHIGYKEIGRFRKCGYKFSRWYDMIWMEKIIGEHRDNPASVVFGSK